MKDNGHKFTDRTPEAEIPYSVKNSKLWEKISFYQMIYSMSGLLLGLVCIIAGIILFANGYFGSTSITAKIIGSEVSIKDTAPGGVLLVIGFMVIAITKFSIKVKK